MTKTQVFRTAMGRVMSWLRRQPLLVPGPGKARYLSAVALALLAAASGTQIAIAKITGLPDDAAFRIKGTVVTERELDDRAQALATLYGVQRPNDPAALDRFKRDVAKAVAVSEILQRAAQERGIVIPDKAAQDQLDRLIADTYPAGRDDFIARLGQVGLSEREVVAEIKRQLANARLFEQVTRDVPEATDPEVRQAYEKRRKEMVDPEKRHLRNIVVSSESEARQILARLKAGEDFAVIAREASLDGSTKDNGGDLGMVTRDQLDTRYAEAAFRAAPNSFFGPVQTQYGWNVGQVLKVKPAVPLPFEQVQDKLRQQLNIQRKLNRWNAWLAEQIRAAKVEYAPRYRPANPDELPENFPR